MPAVPMRLLYISPAAGPDYQCDMLLHGLRGLLGDDAVDVGRLWYLYADAFRDDPVGKARLYGKGFTLYGMLGSDAGVDRSDIERKIRARHFDLVVYGSVHRGQAFLPLVLDHYPAKDILFIDGEDEADRLFWPLLGRGLYFKREHAGQPQLLPIQFAIPAEKIAAGSAKTRLVAHIDPRDRSTYIYDSEADYYADYGRSLFAVTTKKAGWDCLRHYEIMANRCIPLFIGLDACPPLTMHRLPRYEIWQLNHLLERHGPDHFQRPEGVEAWRAGMERMVAHLRRHLTTVALARYVIDCWKAGGVAPGLLSGGPRGPG